MQSRPRVLLVDDEPAVLGAVSRVLGRAFDVDTAGGATEALNLLASRRYCAVVSDQNMPGGSGTWLLAQVRQRQPAVWRVLCTGAQLDPRELPEGVVQALVHKPTVNDELLVAVLGGLADERPNRQV